MQLSVADALATDRHAVHFYDGTSELICLVGEYAASAVLEGGTALIIATPEHQDQLSAWLEENRIPVECARRGGQLIQLDAASTLDEFMSDGLPDPVRFDSVIGSALREACEVGEVSAFGEMVALLWDAGNPDGALELERLWNGIAERFPFRLLCAYPNRAASDPGAVPVLADVCAVHSRVTGVAPSDEDAERTATFALGPDSAGAARRFVSSVLAEWGLSDLIYDAWLVVTELAANAMAHGRSDFTVGISRASGGLKISVGDAGAGNPRMLEPAPDSAGGRGLGLVAGLAAAWGQVRSPIGKLVWAFLDSPGLTPRSG